MPISSSVSWGCGGSAPSVLARPPPSLLLRGGGPAHGHVEQGGRDDDRPGDELLVVLVDADEDEPVRDHPEDRGAEERAEDASGAAEQARPADDDGGDHLEPETLAGERIR